MSIIVALALGVSYCALAGDIEVGTDIKCIVVGARLSTSTDAGLRYRAGMLLMYYLGRFDGHAAPYNLESLLSEATNMTPAEFEAETRRCSDALAEKGKEIVQIGQDLSRLGK
jgi:hypothetical protein